MIFSFDYVELSSLNGFDRWGEFKNDEKMVSKLEELRKNNEIHSNNHTVLMTGYTKQKSGAVKKIATYRLSFLNGQWVICLNMPN